MNKIEAQWQSYMKDVVPKEAGATQIRETRRAFFAGAEAMMNICQAVGTEHVSEAEGAQIMEGAYQELQRFCAGVREGRY